MTDQERLIASLVDKQEVAEVILRYAQAVDRKDWVLLRSCYHDDAYDDHGPYHGDPAGLIAWIQDRHETIETSMHFIGNMLVEVSGDVAFAESYFVAYQRLATDAEQSNGMLGDKSGDPEQPPAGSNMRVAGRYVDRLERRDQGPWRIAHRIVAADSVRLESTNSEMPLEGTWVRGKRTRDDALYRIRDL